MCVCVCVIREREAHCLHQLWDVTKVCRVQPFKVKACPWNIASSPWLPFLCVANPRRVAMSFVPGLRLSTMDKTIHFAASLEDGGHW